jgi:hypothetical protein
MASKPSRKKAKGARSCRQTRKIDNREIERLYYVINCIFPPTMALLALLSLVLAWLAYAKPQADPPEQKPAIIIILEPTVQISASPVKRKVRQHSIPKPKVQEPCTGFEHSDNVAR